MVVLPEVVHLVAGHFADGFPALLDFVEPVEGGANLLLFAVDQCAELLEKSFLRFEVLLFLLFKFLEVLLATGTVAVVQGVELLGDTVVLALVVILVASVGQEGFESGFLHFVVEFVEAGADGLRTTLDLLHLFGHQLLQGGQQAFAVKCAVVDFRLGGFLVVLFGNRRGLFSDGSGFNRLVVGRSLDGGLLHGNLGGLVLQLLVFSGLQGGVLFHD